MRQTNSGSVASRSARMVGKTLMPSSTITAVKLMSTAASQRQITSERHYTTRASVCCSSTRSLIERIKCSKSSAMRGDQWPIAHKYVNYSVGSNTLNSKIQSRLLKSGLTFMALHIQKRLISSQPRYLRFQSTNFPKRFPEFSADSPDIPIWLGSSLCSLSTRLTQQGGGRFISRYCGNSLWRIAKKSPWDWNRARATRHCTRPVLHCDNISVTGENPRR